MNSLFQQIYMTPTLRYGLMAAKSPESMKATDNILLQIQLMFTYLQHSEKQYFDPSVTFCKVKE